MSKSDKISINFFKIFETNYFGNSIDKKFFNNQEINKNEYNVLNLTNSKLIKDSNSNSLFIALYFEYIHDIELLKNNDAYYLSHFPIQLDTTCNGYQYLSLLTGNVPLASQFNLISGDNNTKPKDFYGFVGLKINDYLKRLFFFKKNHQFIT